MPRVTIKAKQYKISDFSLWLDKQMYNHKMKRYEMAAVIDTSPQNYSYKHKTGYWTYEDVLTFIHYFDCDSQEIVKLMTYN